MTPLAPARTGPWAGDSAGPGLDQLGTDRWRRGLAGLFALLTLLAGLPTVLVFTVGWPLPATMPTPAALHRLLSTPLTDDTLLRVLIDITWLTWAHVAVHVLAEAQAQLRGRPSPRLPFGGPSQVLAIRLVAAALVLLPGTPALMTGPVLLTRATAAALLAAPAPAPVTAATAPAAVTLAADAAVSPAQYAPGGPAGTPAACSGLPGPDSAAPAAAEPVTVVVVQPPQGRWHDTLWDIAARHLGDPLRYPEIYQLNRGRLQPDGNRLTRESLIQPGWVLRLPADAVHAEALPAAPLAAPDPPTQPEGQRAAGPPAANAPAESGPDALPAQPDPVVPTPPGRGSEPSPAREPAPVAVPATGDRPAAAAADSGDRRPALHAAVPAGVGLGLGALALLFALERAQRSAGRRRRPGRRVAPVPAHLQPVESAVRVAARRGARDATAVQLTVRLATRLAAARQRPLPLLAVVHRPDGTVELQLASDPSWPMSSPAPAPFLDTAGGWLLAPDAAGYLAAAADGEDPRPALVPIGQLADATCLVDLEAAGLVGITGEASSVTDLLTAVVLALAGAPWASSVRVLADPTLARRLPRLDRVEVCAGHPAEPAAGPDGRDAPTVGPAEGDLTARTPGLLSYAAAAAAEVRGGGHTSLAAARAAGAAASTELVLLAGFPVPALPAELAAAAADPASPLLALVLGAPAGGVAWMLRGGRLAVPGLPEPLTPARADPGRLAGVAALLTEIAAAPDVPAEHPDYAQLRTDAPSSPAPPVAADPDPAPDAAGPGNHLARPQPPGRFEVAVLGPVELIGAPVPDRPVLLEIAVYLALHRRGVTGEQLATALNPDGLLAAKTLRNRVGELRRLLDGAISNGPRWRLAEAVTSDWARFQALAAGDRAQQHAALELVRGRPFDGLDAPEWLFRERFAAEVEAAVLDLAAAVARDALHRGEPAVAARAAAAGLRANPDDERLRRLEMRAAAAAGDLSRLRAVMGELKALVAADDDPEHAITEETRTLYGRLLREAQRRPAQGTGDQQAASA